MAAVTLVDIALAAGPRVSTAGRALRNPGVAIDAEADSPLSGKI